MNPQIINFLNKEMIGCLTVILPDGNLHSATIHFSHQENPLKLFIQTSDTTQKVRPFLNGEIGKGSMVIGFSEEDWITFQMHGTVRMVSDQSELQEVYKVHYAKHPESEKYKGPKTVFLEFTPTWSRYTDFNTHPETIIESGLQK